MLVALSVDMEGASQLRSVREIFGCMPEYWETGKPRLEADVAAACEGLLAGGASEVVVLDNHGGNTINVSAESLPAGARLETWHVYDLPGHGVDAMFQVGYHARGGVDGFLSHTYMPGLRLRVAGELISESHCRAWAAEVPLLGIVGNDLAPADARVARRDAVPGRPEVRRAGGDEPRVPGPAGRARRDPLVRRGVRTAARLGAVGHGPGRRHLRGEHAERRRRRRGDGRRRLDAQRRRRVRGRARDAGATRGSRSPPR